MPGTGVETAPTGQLRTTTSSTINLVRASFVMNVRLKQKKEIVGSSHGKKTGRGLHF